MDEPYWISTSILVLYGVMTVIILIIITIIVVVVVVATTLDNAG